MWRLAGGGAGAVRGNQSRTRGEQSKAYAQQCGMGIARCHPPAIGPTKGSNTARGSSPLKQNVE